MGAVDLPGGSGLTAEQSGLLNKLNYFDLSSALGETNCGLRFATNNVSLVSGRVIWSYFMARRTFTASAIATYTLGTAAGGTTAGFQGIYSVAANGDLTLLSSITSDTTLWGSTNSRYASVLTTPVSIVAGQIYATAILIVTAGAVPSILCMAQTANTADGQAWQLQRPMAAALTGQATLPASAASGTLIQQGGWHYAEVLI